MSNHAKDDLISKRMLMLLTELSGCVNRIAKLNNDLQWDPCFGCNPCFLEYICSFGQGRRCHFRCMGFMNCLVLSKCDLEGSLCHWKKDLLMPAHDNFTCAFEALSKVHSHNPTFCKLNCEVEGMKAVAAQILETLKPYRLSC